MNLINKVQYYLNKAGIFSANIPELKKRNLINDRTMLKFLVRQEYQELKEKYNYYLAQEQIAQKYNIPVTTVQNWLYK